MTENETTSEQAAAPPHDDPSDTSGSWKQRRLRKSHDRRLAGVSGGIAEYLDVDPTLVRLAFVLLALVGVGAGIVVYAVLWLVLPDPDDGLVHGVSEIDGAPTSTSTGLSKRQIAGVALGGLALLIFADGLVEFRSTFLVPVILIVAGVALLARRPEAPAQKSRSGGAGPEQAHGGDHLDDGAESPTNVEAADRPMLPMVAGTLPPPPPPGSGSPPSSAGPKHPRAPKPPKEPSMITPIVLSLMAISAGIVLLFDRADVIDASLAMVGGVWLLIIGAGLVLATWRGRATGLIAIGILVALATLLARYIDPILEDGGGERSYVVTRLVDLQDEYRLGAGELVLDLADLDLEGESRIVDVKLGVGELRILVPDEPDVIVHVDNDIGNSEIRDRVGRPSNTINEAGLGNELDQTFVGTDPESGTLELDVRLNVGEVVVTRVP